MRTETKPFSEIAQGHLFAFGGEACLKLDATRYTKSDGHDVLVMTDLQTLVIPAPETVGRIVAGPASIIRCLNRAHVSLIAPNRVRLLEPYDVYDKGDEIEIEPGEFVADTDD